MVAWVSQCNKRETSKVNGFTYCSLGLTQFNSQVLGIPMPEPFSDSL